MRRQLCNLLLIPLLLALFGLVQPAGAAADFGGAVAIAAGYATTVAVKSDGTVWAWGWNDYGQLGNGSNSDSSIPVQVIGLNGVTAVAAGNAHTTALKKDGTVWAWGDNEHGQLGDGTSAFSRNTPVQVAGLNGVTAIATGNFHTVALKGDGTVWTWGWDSKGQLGNGTTSSSFIPVQVPGVSGVAAIAAGNSHTVALKNDGTIWTWGDNGNGELGDGTTSDRLSPVQVSGLTGVTAIAAGYRHTVALKADGTVWAWGRNGDGELGTGTYSSSLVPVQIPGLSGVAAIGAGDHTVALTSDGIVWGWGPNHYGQLGNGTYEESSVPVQARGVSGVTAVAAGFSYTVALKSDGTIMAWGDNSYAQLGNGTVSNSLTPVETADLSGVTAISAGDLHTVTLASDGTVWAWGWNGSGQLGNGSINKFGTTPVQVAGLSPVSSVSAGAGHTMALKSDGTVWAWGYNFYQQLGNGSPSDSRTPVQVSGLSGVTAIAAGSYHSVALKSDGTVWGWGYSFYGQLGNGTNPWTISTPVQAAGLSGVTAIAAGLYQTVALKNDGTVWAWGRNDYGALGDGTKSDSNTPVQVSGLSGVTAIAAGDNFTLALKSDGTVWAWGRNEECTLGNPLPMQWDSSTPAQVPGLSGVTAIAAGSYHSVALKGDGTVRAWGFNAYGQLGNYTAYHTSCEPVQVLGLDGVSTVSAGYSHTVALRKDGTVLAWGWNDAGQLGTGTVSANLPTKVYPLLAPQTLTVSGTGSGTVHSGTSPSTTDIYCTGQCTAPFPNGVVVTLTAAPASGYSFSGWAGEGCSGTGSCVVTLDAARSVTAAFVANEPLVVTVSGTGGGSVTSTPQGRDPVGIACTAGACSTTFPLDTSVTLSATPDHVSTFAGWSGACTGAGACSFPMTGPQGVTATFAKAPKAKIGPVGYSSLAAAYADAGAGATILTLDSTMPDPGLLLGSGKTVTIKGGYLANFSGRSGLATPLNGPLIITSGELSVDRLVVK